MKKITANKFACSPHLSQDFVIFSFANVVAFATALQPVVALIFIFLMNKQENEHFSV